IDNTLAFFLQLIQATNGTFHLDVHDIVANDDHAIALVSSSLEVDGKKYESKGAHVVHVKDGKVTESWFFDWDPYQQDELFPA
ncbi:MAG TPA: nuclear transport factor 2 family protein, partial [Candidatus Acidoferrales bacterium]|nr:nuclear transport factor 2 family protein [Candidatus Acidoferrales bacterium]